MSNRHLNSHFAGCLLLAKGYDEYRKREVQLFMLPGEFNLVGISDGTDSWLAPVSADPLRLNVRAVLESVRNGTFKEPAGVSKRHRILANEAVRMPRIKVLAAQEVESEKPARRRIINVQA